MIKKINKKVNIKMITELIKLSEIFLALNENVKTIGCDKHSKRGCNGRSTKCITHNLWDELDLHINNFFENKKLEDLIRN